VSLLKAVYWLADYSLGYWARVFPDLVRAKFVVFDRYLVDTIVDPKRYRYGGPSWVLRLVWRLVPKPDLVILLDAPAEIFHARKQEVPIEETMRQQAAYRALVSRLPTGHVVDGAQEPAKVAADVVEIVVETMARRTGKRLGLGSRHG
jgi:thymidylate kinase